VFAVDLWSQDVILKVYKLLVHMVLLFVLKTVKNCYCKMLSRRCNLYKPVGCWLMCRKCVHFDRNVKDVGFSFKIPCNFVYHSGVIFAFVEIGRRLRRHDQDGWCRIFVLKTSNAIIVVTTCNGCIVYVAYSCYIFLHETKLLFMPRLFYGKYYVTIVIRELLRFSICYLGKFL